MLFKDSLNRSIFKSLSWRVIASLITIILVYIATGEVAIAAAVGGVEVISKLFAYYLHERVWDNIKFGKTVLENRGSNAFVLWFTGLPCSGKSTLAAATAKALKENGVALEELDGDIVREVFKKTGFSKEERTEHIRRVGFTVSLLEKNGTPVVASFVSPYQETRDFVRERCRNFVEIYVATSPERCEERDVKGMYKKAREGEIKNFTGVDGVYEEPKNPEIKIDTHGKEVEECVSQIMNLLTEKGFIE